MGWAGLKCQPRGVRRRVQTCVLLYYDATLLTLLTFQEVTFLPFYASTINTMTKNLLERIIPLPSLYEDDKYRKSYERECISRFMSTSDVLKVLKMRVQFPKFVEYIINVVIQTV